MITTTKKEFKSIVDAVNKAIKQVEREQKDIRVRDGFAWLVITEKAKDVYGSGLFDVYKLHDDGSESLCESYADVNDALEFGLDLAIEVGFLPK